MNEREKTRGGKHWDPRGASRPRSRRAAGAQEGGRRAGRPKLGGRGVSGARASPPARAPPAAQPARPFCGKLSHQNLGEATCPAHLDAGVSSRVPPLSPNQTNRGGELGRAQFLCAAFKDTSSARAPTPRPARGASRAVPTSPGQGGPSPVPGAGGAVGARDARCLCARHAARILVSASMNNPARKRLEWGPGLLPCGPAAGPPPGRCLTLGRPAELDQ